jgi:polyhydroxybutyrate depolymerase
VIARIVVAVVLALACVAGAEAQVSRQLVTPDGRTRTYTAYLPNSARGGPLVIALHGGGGDGESMARTTCPSGLTLHPLCLHNLGGVKGFATIYPDSSEGWWNAGGGQNGYLCIGGTACIQGIDDVAFLRALVKDLATAWPYDASRIYVTGISNGAAMTHRLACEAADVFAAFAPVAHGNQHVAAGGACTPGRPVPILYTHGSADPASLAPYDGSERICRNGICGRVGSAGETIAFWQQQNGCGPRSSRWLANTAVDGTLTRADRYVCGPAVLEHRYISGGGHTWPDGWQYLGEWLVGRTERDWNGNEDIWRFFSEYTRQAN